MGKLSIFTDVSGVPGGMHKIPNDGLFTIMPEGDSHRLFQLPCNSISAGVKIMDAKPYQDDIEIVVAGKRLYFEKGLLKRGE